MTNSSYQPLGKFSIGSSQFCEYDKTQVLKNKNFIPIIVIESFNSSLIEHGVNLRVNL